MSRENFGLVKFTFTLLERMQWHGHDEIPAFIFQNGNGFAQQQIGEKIFKPQCVGIFETMYGFEHDSFGDDRRARGTEMQFHFAAIRAFKFCREITVKRQTATFTKGRANKTDVRPALRANKTVARDGALFVAKLADFRIKQAEPRIQPGLTFAVSQSHAMNLFRLTIAKRKFAGFFSLSGVKKFRHDALNVFGEKDCRRHAGL